MYRIWQKLCAEFIGTFLFVFLSVGAVCADAAFRSTSQPAGAGQPGFGLVGVALARGLAFAILVCALAPVSGGHFNPAITLGCWVTRTLGSLQAIFYGVAQILGAILASWTLARLIPAQIWQPVALATPDLASGTSRTQGIIFELLLTFILVFVFCATVADSRNDSLSSRFSGFAPGLAIFAGVLAGSPFVGASMNPAMLLGTAVASHHWTNHGVYWAGSLLGGVLAAWIYHALFARQH